MNNHLHGKTTVLYRRIGIVATYVLIIVGSLYLPLIIDFFTRSERVLHVYTFTNNFKEELIREFEQTHGVKVNIRYFDSNEELLAKFKISGGKGYDVITPSDYMVELLVRSNLLHAFDKKQLPVMQELDHRLLGKYFDPSNNYSLPLMWFPYGIVYAKDIFAQEPIDVSYSIIFKNPALLQEGVITPYRICMCDDYRESIVFASLYLYGGYDAADTIRLSAIQELLISQKKWIESYVNQDLRYYLLAGIIKAAVAPAVFVRKIIEESDCFDFKIPQEGGLLTIENVAIPRASKNIPLAYAFINFILSKNSAAQNSAQFGFNPSNQQAYALLDQRFAQNKHFFPDQEQFARLHILSNTIPIKEYEKLWLTVKSN